MKSAKAVVAEHPYYSRLDSAMSRGPANDNSLRSPSRTITGMKRWSIINKDLPRAWCTPRVVSVRRLLY
jgi:hypothetical protein